MANTNAHPAAGREAHCRSLMCRKDCSATGARASSSHRPKDQTARSPHRHRQSRLADGGSYIRPAATANAGIARSARGRICAAVATLHLGKRNNARRLNASCALCRDREQDLARFRRREQQLLFSRHIFRAFWEQCSKSLWTGCIPPDTIFMTLVKTYDCMIDSSSAKWG